MFHGRYKTGVLGVCNENVIHMKQFFKRKTRFLSISAVSLRRKIIGTEIYYAMKRIFEKL